jgi:nucleoside 2-deoxyribosyltransferase
MATCFVIQPFDSGKFDKRFTDIYKPSIEAAGLNAYRVDQDPSVSVPIDAIEEGIRKASVCLADITADNPNVWYELGFAFAAGRPVVMVCSEERTGKKYPFDIQHRSIINYLAEAPSDFDKLRESLTTRIKALLQKS